MRTGAGKNAIICSALLVALSHPAIAGRLVPGTGLDHCKARGEHRIPVPIWSVDASTEALSRSPPPPAIVGGSIVYIVLGADMYPSTFDIRSGGAVYPESCGKFSYSPLVSFDLPKDRKNFAADGTRLHLRALGTFSHGTCSYVGFFISESAPHAAQGWTDLTFDPADKTPPRDRYCVADVNTGPRPGPRKALPACGRTAHRIPIPVWRPAVSADGELASDPPQQPGLIVSISIDVKRAADGNCVGWRNGDFRFVHKNPLGSANNRGLAVRLRGNDSAGPTSCRLSGFYLNEPIFDAQDGWSKTFFGAIDANRVIDSGQYCLARGEDQSK